MPRNKKKYSDQFFCRVTKTICRKYWSQETAFIQTAFLPDKYRW